MHLKPVILKFILIAIGKTDSPYADEGIKEYEKRLNKYMTFGIKLIPDIRNSRNMPETVQKEKEGEALLEETGANDILILVDERGKEMNSPDFSRFIENITVNSSKKRILFAVGGPYGFSEKVYRRADYKIALSKMTFSHQMVRLIFMEQLYRAMTIIRHEPYHH